MSDREHLRDDPEMVAWSPSEFTLRDMRVDPDDVTRFLARLAVTGNVTDACRVSRVSSKTVYRMRRNIPEFRGAWERALESARDAVDMEVFKRGVVGTKRKVFHRGKQVGVITEYSDRLLELRARAMHPAYKNIGKVEVKQSQHQEVQVAVGPPIPDSATLGENIKRLAEIAVEQGLMPAAENQ